MWIEPEPDGHAWPVWYAWSRDAAYVVAGDGEQQLPPLPDRVTLVVRAQDTSLVAGRRVARVPASAQAIAPYTDPWQQAAAMLAFARLNSPEADLPRRWAQTATIWRLQPDLDGADESAGRDEPSGAAEPQATPATTLRWSPTHRPARRGKPRPR